MLIEKICKKCERNQMFWNNGVVCCPHIGFRSIYLEPFDGCVYKLEHVVSNCGGEVKERVDKIFCGYICEKHQAYSIGAGIAGIMFDREWENGAVRCENGDCQSIHIKCNHNLYE